ncbi:enoyl-CoA hydratase/isomerase family protein [Bradyrhizobium sp. 153]|uniref:enoyl-CoA hydratase/isomerase family protein n=1 Tax=Bradyrhizobium sp. 153 TaxID=2782627 RepID=UPI001FFAAD62|nr:enoyl-CoA hydratase/isomerase family protein [Bradyrhizobium sp. 153]MCK1663544.1 enoyl-CoA hydratase/isomerase family protein [Bradyrhizobium sp. 153]
MLRLEANDGTLVVTLDVPAKLNAWSSAMRAEPAASLRDAADDASVRAVVVTGAGNDAFCAGADLAEAGLSTPEHAQARMEAYRDFYLALQTFPKPLVAALNGIAVGSGFQAVLLMAARIAHDKVRSGLPEVSSGIRVSQARPSFPGPLA